MGPYTNSAVSLIVATIFAAASWHFLEKPLSQQGRLLISRLRSKSDTDKYTNQKKYKTQWKTITLSISISFLFFGSIYMQNLTTNHDFVSVNTMASEIINYGPKKVKVGKPFNVVSNGQSAIWIVFSTPPPKDTKIRFGTTLLNTIVGEDNVASAIVPLSLVSKAELIPISLEHRTMHQIQKSESVFIEAID